MNKKVISILLIIIVFCSAFGTLGYFYLDLNNKYKNLQLEHTKLQGSYNQLHIDFNDLNSRYSNLNIQYNELNIQYQSLFADYDTLSNVFNKPLSYELIPNAYELNQWLFSDNTDTISYSLPNFICGDFAVMLSQHAKLKHWDMGIVSIYGYNVYTSESYAHAINIIYTQEGLVYIEPQNDQVWWYAGHQTIYPGSTWEIGNVWIAVTFYTMVVWA